MNKLFRTKGYGYKQGVTINHHRVEIYCDISGTEEYTPLANFATYGLALRAHARGLGSDLGGQRFEPFRGLKRAIQF